MPSTSDIFAFIPVISLPQFPEIPCVNDCSSTKEICVMSTDFNILLVISAILICCCGFVCWKMSCKRERSKCVSYRRVENEDKQLLTNHVKDATVAETGDITLFSSVNDLLKSTSDIEVNDVDISTIGFITKDGTEDKHAVKDSNEPKCDENENSIGFMSTEKVGKVDFHNSTGISADDGITENKLVESEPSTQLVSGDSVFKVFLTIQEELLTMISSLNEILDEGISRNRNSVDKMEGKTCINNPEHKFCKEMDISKNIALKETKESTKNLKEFFDLDSADEINEALTNACRERISETAVCKWQSTPLNEITERVSSVKKIIDAFLSNVAALTAKDKEMHSNELKNIATEGNKPHSLPSEKSLAELANGMREETPATVLSDISRLTDVQINQSTKADMQSAEKPYECFSDLRDSGINHQQKTSSDLIQSEVTAMNNELMHRTDIGKNVSDFELSDHESDVGVVNETAFTFIYSIPDSKILSLDKWDNDLSGRALQGIAEIESNFQKDVNEDVSKEPHSSPSEQSLAELANGMREETPATVLSDISRLADIQINQSTKTDKKSAEKSSECFSNLHESSKNYQQETSSDLIQSEITAKNNELMHRTDIGKNGSDFELSDHESDIGVVNETGLTFIYSTPKIISLSTCVNLSRRALQGNYDIESNFQKDVKDVSREPHSSPSEQYLGELPDMREETPAPVLSDISHLTDETMHQANIGKHGSNSELSDQESDIGVVNKIDLTFIYSLSDINKS